MLRYKKRKVYLSCYRIVVITCLGGESICTANGHLYNLISLYYMISTVGLPQGVGEEELGNINRKMTSSKRAPFSTYCWLASWFRADKQIWPESRCSLFWRHQHSRRIGNISRGGRCGCDSCRPQLWLREPASPWQKPRAKLIVINFDYGPFPLKWLSRWICPVCALNSKLLRSASANASARLIFQYPFPFFQPLVPGTDADTLHAFPTGLLCHMF